MTPFRGWRFCGGDRKFPGGKRIPCGGEVGDWSSIGGGL